MCQRVTLGGGFGSEPGTAVGAGWARACQASQQLWLSPNCLSREGHLGPDFNRMTALTLKIDVVRINQVTSADRSDDQAKTFRFGANMTVGEVLEQIVQKTGEGGKRFGFGIF